MKPKYTQVDISRDGDHEVCQWPTARGAAFCLDSLSLMRDFQEWDETATTGDIFWYTGLYDSKGLIVKHSKI